MERRSIKTLLSQGAAGGVCGTFLLSCAIAGFYPENSLIVGFLFPFNLVLAAVVGTAIGFVIWLSEKVFHRNWSVLSRIAISILFMMLLLVVFRMLLSPDPEGSDVEFPALYFLVCLVSFAMPTGMITGSRVRPWRLIARGAAAGPRRKLLFRRDPIRISNTIQELRFSFLAGLPLRLTALLGLMWSLLLTICFLCFFFANWRAEDWEQVAHLSDDSIECALVTLYFAATVFVSFTPRHKWVALGVAFFLHVPLAIWMRNDLGLTPHYDYLRTLAAILIGLWLLFLIGLMVLPVKRSEARVEYGHTEIRFGKRQWVKESS